ncbi:hypothetical protein TSUD_100350 [Trifolium subterraneum]|uniref:Uncharacterized protein n=1 Tax=Trifolium subterraneum TaxID=3900 RepID=A0A2Z6P7U2_TRISU|nr:hypothetical protein TSUD_100350 [Trifolium subterraneum]
MVLLRELDGAKDYPLVIHPVGSDWERQVRAHFTRADGTLNINGYYEEMFGFPYSSSWFESSDSDGSGSDSNCVIISPSEFSSTNPNNRFLIVAYSVATISTSMETSSRFISNDLVSTFRKVVRVSGEGEENRVIIDPVAEGEFVTIVNEKKPHYFYMLSVMSSSDLIARADKPQSLEDYLSKFNVYSLGSTKGSLSYEGEGPKAEAAIAAASVDAMAQMVVEEVGVKGTKRKNQEESSQISVEIPKRKKITNAELEEEEADDEALKIKRVPRSKSLVPPNSSEGGSNDFDSFSVVNESFQKYARTSSLSELDFEDLRQAAIDHHIQGAMLSYYLSTRQELDTIEARNKMESADNSLSALEKEFAAAKSKFEEDLATMKAGQEEVVKAAVKAKDDEVIALKGRVKTLEGELDVTTKETDKATTQRDEASLNVEALTARIESLELEGASQFDDGFRFALEQVKVAFPDVDVIKLDELDSINQIVGLRAYVLIF